MKRFITTIICLFLPPALLCAVALWTEWNVFCSAVRKPDCTVGIIGDSRPACGVNEAYFPGLANFAQRASQSMVWRAKLRVILDENPQLKMFFLELSPASYLRMPDKSANERAAFIRGHVPATVLLDIVCPNEMGDQPSYGFARHFIQGVLKPFVCRLVTRSSKSDLQDDYYPLDRKLADSQWWKRGALVEPSSTSYVPMEESGVRADVEDMIQTLQARNIRVFLVTLPFLPQNDDKVYVNGQWPFFEKEMDDLCVRYGCKWLNYRRAMPDIDDWADSGHLNVTGAVKFTSCFANFQTGGW